MNLQSYVTQLYIKTRERLAKNMWEKTCHKKFTCDCSHSIIIRCKVSCIVGWACFMHSASFYTLHWATHTYLPVWYKTSVRPATIDCKISGVIAYGAKAKRPSCLCQKPPLPSRDHWCQQAFSPVSSPLNCWVSFLLGPDTICMNAPSRSAASLWSGVQVTFLPAKAFGPPQPQQICKLFTLHFPHLEKCQVKPGTRPTRKNQQIGP